MNKNSKFLLSAAGIFVSYFYYGIMQEKITKGKYPLQSEDGSSTYYEKYSYALSLVFIQCLVSYLFSKVAAVRHEVEDKKHNLNLLYSGAALTYILAMVCSNMALQWVSYPTQVVGKSVKPIPVMILGVLIGKKSYPMRKYLFVLLVVIGVALFIYKDQSGSTSNQELFGFGEILLILSLIMDGLTGAMQELMRANAKPSGEQMMLNMNFWSCIYLGIGLILTGEGMEFSKFVGRHPYVLYNITLLALAGAIGQHFIYFMVSGFGPLPVSIVTTTRKFVTVLASVVIFGNSLIPRQWLGTIIVFSGLFLDSVYSKSAPKKKEVN
ncbi:PREDICTED: solute carrier family 35 member B1 homolog [Nicrophorus vespilloides]|uniref:Solute carrier family 35 member B1 homolog n=1 Tax=Nicrophorus vespilloides TaxID=110193 RepID=A0ABM1MSZ6_NICVS|nr:PREDICTED: solute carrier family 35 member B1 homolog [Nicrophorus vespilloides]